jgi:hypothetical protein
MGVMSLRYKQKRYVYNVEAAKIIEIGLYVLRITRQMVYSHRAIKPTDARVKDGPRQQNLYIFSPPQLLWWG